MTTIAHLPATGNPQRRRYQYSLRELLLLMTLACSLCASWTGLVQPAREAARRVQCPNHLFQHSGQHPPRVELDKNLQVVKVSACRLCIWNTPPSYYDVSQTNQWVKPESVPPSSVARAESLLEELKGTRPYCDWKGVASDWKPIASQSGGPDRTR